MAALTTLHPPLLWHWFTRICAIPRASYHEQQLAALIVKWARENNLWAEQDTAGNVLIRKAASVGYADRIPVALQAHLDMVCQKIAGSPHDFSRDTVKPYIAGDWVQAGETTLGADNGIGLASTLAVLADPDLPHPPLEVLLTVSEETGMEGALGLQPGWLNSQWLINTDSECDGEICIGGAGGVNAVLALQPQYQPNSFAAGLKITVSGGAGGHSGIDITKKRLNTLQFTARLLASLSPVCPFALTEFKAGSAHNAIPRSAEVSLNLESAKITTAQNELKKIFTALYQESSTEEPNLVLHTEAVPAAASGLTPAYQQNLLALLTALPNGVQSWSKTIEGVAESSLNLAVINLSPEGGDLLILIRSLSEPAKAALRQKITAVARRFNFAFIFSHDYPGWEPEKSALLTLTQAQFQAVNGTKAKLSVIHAGLECGLLRAVYPHLQIVSMGPTIENAHSPAERVKINTVERYWRILTRILAHIPAGAPSCYTVGK